jgi:uncharacterized protein (DUF1330 family)
MAAYVLVDLDVKNAAGLDNYRSKVGDTLTKYGGKFIVRGGAHEVLEGDWQPKRIVVLEFPSMDALKRWYNSPEYRPLIAERQRAASGPLVAVEGV